jgi:drug/metabolite transporter (DMT)-like permease
LSKKVLAHLALLIANLIYGGSFFIAKTVMPEYLSPNVFILLRVVGATLLFWTLRVFLKEKIATKDLGLIATCGFFGVFILIFLFQLTLKEIPELNVTTLIYNSFNTIFKY